MLLIMTDDACPFDATREVRDSKGMGWYAIEVE